MADAGYRPEVPGTARWAILARVSDEQDAGGSGFRGVGIALGFFTTFFYTAIVWLTVFTLWIVISVYAIVKWAGNANDDPNPVVIVLGAAMVVVLFTVLFAATVSLIGRAMNPMKRAKR
jgi:hypothetical protein